MSSAQRIHHKLIFGRLAIFDEKKRIIIWEHHAFNVDNIKCPTFLRRRFKLGLIGMQKADEGTWI